MIRKDGNPMRDIKNIVGNHGFEETREDVEGLFGGFIDGEVLTTNSDRIVRRINQSSYGSYSSINIIPSDKHGQCCRELTVMCFGNDSLEKRITDMLIHVGVTCRNYNKKVLFLTSLWNLKTYLQFENEVERLRQDGVDIVFVLLTNNGAVEIPV